MCRKFLKSSVCMAELGGMFSNNLLKCCCGVPARFCRCNNFHRHILSSSWTASRFSKAGRVLQSCTKNDFCAGLSPNGTSYRRNNSFLKASRVFWKRLFWTIFISSPCRWKRHIFFLQKRHWGPKSERHKSEDPVI